MKEKSHLFFIVLLFISVLADAKDYNILDFGAKNDTSFTSTQAFNKAIARCSENGGGRIIVPAGKFKSGSIVLKDNIELYLEPGATIYASSKHRDFPRQEQPEYRSQKDPGGWYSLIYAEGASNISVTGKGTIDGQGSKQQGRPDAMGGDRDGRPRCILFISCKNVVVRDVNLMNAGIWTQHYLNCDDVLIDDIYVFAHSNRNNDGIDIDGCRRVVLSNSTFDSSDDAICLKSTGTAPCEDVIISNCIASSFCNGIKCGTETTGGFKNINISNCIVRPSKHPRQPTKKKPFNNGISGIALEIVDGGTMDGVTVNNLLIEGTQSPVYVRLGNRGRKHRDDAPEPLQGQMRNINISNVLVYNCGNYSSSVTGIPGAYINGVTLRNIRIVPEGGLKKGDFLKSFEDVLEDVKGYPESMVWGNLPSCGLFIRHAKNVKVDGLAIEPLDTDPRPVVMAEDVIGLIIKGVNKGSNCQATEWFKQKDVSFCKTEFELPE